MELYTLPRLTMRGCKLSVKLSYCCVLFYMRIVLSFIVMYQLKDYHGNSKLSIHGYYHIQIAY